MNDFRAEPQDLKSAMKRAASETIDSGWYILGERVSAFEKAWAGACGTRHAVGVANGMDAIEIGLRALDIGPGDEVITTAMTAFPTVLAILRAGANPVLADIDPDTALLSLTSVEKSIGPKTKAVLVVHLYGRLQNMAAWKSFCSDHKIHLLEDCAQSHLASENGQVAGSFGAFGAYSFYPTKNLGAPGDGGALITNDEGLFKLSSSLRNYGQTDRYHHPYLGLNSRLDEIHAAILLERMKWLKDFTLRRRQIAEAYWTEINNPKITLLAKPPQPENHVHHLFVVKTDDPAKLAAHLKSREIAALSHYPVPIHLQKSTTHLKTAPGGLPNVAQHGQTCLSIPCHPQMTDEHVRQVIGAINDF